MKTNDQQILTKEEKQKIKTSPLFCWFCNNVDFGKNYSFQNYKNFKNQKFIFLRCFKCENLIYFWKNQITQKYFFNKKIHVVLYQPEIAGNVGTIIRLSVGFDFQRSSTNHFNLTNIKIYSDWNDFCQKNNNVFLVFTSSKGKKKLDHLNFLLIDEPIYFVFGSESIGLPQKLKKKYPNQLFNINQTKFVSSINLANAVSIFVFFALFQYEGLNLN